MDDLEEDMLSGLVDLGIEFIEDEEITKRPKNKTSDSFKSAAKQAES